MNHPKSSLPSICHYQIAVIRNSFFFCFLKGFWGHYFGDAIPWRRKCVWVCVCVGGGKYLDLQRKATARFPYLYANCHYLKLNQEDSVLDEKRIYFFICSFKEVDLAGSKFFANTVYANTVSWLKGHENGRHTLKVLTKENKGETVFRD